MVSAALSVVVQLTELLVDLVGAQADKRTFARWVGGCPKVGLMDWGGTGWEGKEEDIVVMGDTVQRMGCNG